MKLAFPFASRLGVLLLLTSGLSAQELGKSPAPEMENEAEVVPYRSRALSGVNRNDRAAVARYYQKYYKKSSDVPNGWSGSVQGCRVGGNSRAYVQATLDRLNYFRAMAGLPADVKFKSEFNARALEAALMMTANRSLSHNPPTTWKCYTAGGKTGASRSNLAIGRAGPGAIDLYMWDPGAHNKEVGHRAWILNPGLAVAGSGSTKNANALYVIGEFRRDKPNVDFVAWPPAGFVPYQFGHDKNYRWSFQKQGVNLKGARVTVRANGRKLRVKNEHRSKSKLVWLVSVPGGRVSTDTRYDVSITAGGETFNYPVVFMDPDVAGSGTLEENSSTTDNAEPEKQPTETVSPARQAIEDRRLINAVYRGRPNDARGALKAGASPNARRKDWTALLLAAYYGRGEIVRLLLKHGADTRPTVSGYNAAAMARAGGYAKIARAIEKQSGTTTTTRPRGGPPKPP